MVENNKDLNLPEKDLKNNKSSKNLDIEDDDENIKDIEDKSLGKKIGDGIMSFFKIIYYSIAFLFTTIKTGLSYIFYPIKENFINCFRAIDYKINPYKNPNYHEI